MLAELRPVFCTKCRPTDSITLDNYLQCEWICAVKHELIEDYDNARTGKILQPVSRVKDGMPISFGAEFQAGSTKTHLITRKMRV